MKTVLYLKTPQGARQLEVRHSPLMDRERQILQLCNASYPLGELIGLFGSGVVRELHAMAARGWVAAGLQIPEPAPDAPPAPADAATGGPVPSAEDWSALQTMRDFATAVAHSLGAGEPERWVQQYSQASNPDSVLRYGALVVEHLFASGDTTRALRVGYKMAGQLTHKYASRFVDALLEGPQAHQAAALYAHLLTGHIGATPDNSPY